MKNPSAKPNALIHESSPYLLQHAYNPVQWYPWGRQALEKAAAENKPLIISIGYSACHWCHVMEKESFEDETTAAIMNDHYICIKVDREERPDIDAIYMAAVQLMTGAGGWPLNCLVLPDQKPIYGGTYFTRSQWQQILLKVALLYKEEPEQCRKYAEELTQGINGMEQVFKAAEHALPDFTRVYKLFEASFDTLYGGMNRTPKFPMPSNWEFLLQYCFLQHVPACNRQLKLTLDKIALGGINDQLGGGFARYATDNRWKVPHFEKMLYDNAQLVSLYSHAWQLLQDFFYKETVYETLDFIKNEMTSSDGGFYSAIDADSEGMEGKYYIWTKEELESLLPNSQERAVFFDYYQIREDELWEDHYILQRTGEEQKSAAIHQITNDELKSIIKKNKNILLEARNNRIRPGLDNKILCSWNSLMLKAYADAYNAFGEDKFLQMAKNNAAYLLKNLYNDGIVYHTLKKDGETIDGFMEDYSLAAEAFNSLYRCTGEKLYLNIAIKITETAIRLFRSDDSQMFYFTASTGEQLIARNMEVQDNVISSSNSVMCRNLQVLGKLTGRQEWTAQARQMLTNMKLHIEQSAPWYANWAQAALFEKQNFEVIICGDKAEIIYKELAVNYLPDCVIAFSPLPDETDDLFRGRFKQGETGIYICENHTCRQPVYQVNEALKLIDSLRIK